jgi:DNA-binding transcriptional MerR regulator
MDMHETKHISEVCKMLDTTSRTIRYYEQLGLIHSTRETPSAPRRLDAENIEQLRRILFLRKIGLSLDEIAIVCREKRDAAELIRSKSVAFSAEITALMERVKLLEYVIEAAEKNEDIYALDLQRESEKLDASHLKTAEIIVDLLLSRRFSEIIPYLIPELRENLTPEFMELSWNRFMEPCGAYITVIKRKTEGTTVKYFLQFEKTGIMIIIPFKGEMLGGLLFKYWNETKRSSEYV